MRRRKRRRREVVVIHHGAVLPLLLGKEKIEKESIHFSPSSPPFKSS